MKSTDGNFGRNKKVLKNRPLFACQQILQWNALIQEIMMGRYLYFPGIYIPSCPVVPDDYNLVRTIKVTSKVALQTSEVLRNQKIFSKILMIL